MNRYKEDLYFFAEAELWKYFCLIHGDTENLFKDDKYHLKKQEFVSMVEETERRIGVLAEFFNITSRPRESQQYLSEIEKILQSGDKEQWEQAQQEVEEKWRQLLGEFRYATWSQDEPHHPDFSKYSKVAADAGHTLIKDDYTEVVWEGKSYQLDEEQAESFKTIYLRRNYQIWKADIEEFLSDCREIRK